MTTNEMEASIKGILKESRKREDLFIKTLFALKYNDRDGAINYLKCGELLGLPKKMVSELIETIRKEQGND